jgi:hypothetical protein
MHVTSRDVKFRKRAAIISLVCIYALHADHAHAVLVTNAASLGSSTVIDFSQFGPFVFTAGPVQIGSVVGDNVTWESTSNISVIGNGGYNLGANGFWDSGRSGFTGTNSDTAAMTYRFLDGPVAGVGGFVNYTVAPDGPSDAIISVLDSNDTVLESYNISVLAPIVTPSAVNDGAFRGILRNSADIYALRLSDKFSVLDDLTYTGQIPEPSSVFLTVIGLTGMLALRKRFRRA